MQLKKMNTKDEDPSSRLKSTIDGPMRRKIGIVGFGKIGKYLYRAVREDRATREAIEIVFVWNRSQEALKEIPSSLRLEKLEDFESRGADLIIEVAHPSISEKFGVRFLTRADYMVGSPAALAARSMEPLLQAAKSGDHGLYVPSGALWGASDIRKMADRNTLGSLSVSMAFHPASVKAFGALREKLQEASKMDGPVTLYSGPVRPLCSLAPNNVNTMAAAALAAHTLGFDRVQGELIVDRSLDAHVITVDARGKPRPNGSYFRALTTRTNPAQHGAVTGSATYVSFLSSMLLARGKGAGVHFC